MSMRFDRWNVLLVLPLALALGLAPGVGLAGEPLSSVQLAEVDRSGGDSGAVARGDEEKRREDAQPRVEAAEVIVYNPPRRGAPRVNVGAGGVRGSLAVPRPLVLAPDHVGDTQHASPALYWHIDGVPGNDVDVVFTLMDDSSDAPLVETKLPRPTGPGIARVDLGRFGVRLEPGAEYEWSIALVRNDASRAQLAVSVGYIRRVGAEGRAARSGADYAEAGIWYDALAALQGTLAADPADAASRAQRDSLLRQAKLDAVIE